MSKPPLRAKASGLVARIPTDAPAASAIVSTININSDIFKIVPGGPEYETVRAMLVTTSTLANDVKARRSNQEKGARTTNELETARAAAWLATAQAMADAAWIEWPDAHKTDIVTDAFHRELKRRVGGVPSQDRVYRKVESRRRKAL